MATSVLTHQKTYLVDGGGFFSAAETRELSTWLLGLTVEQAAQVNNVSPDTVKTHRRALREKTGQGSGIGVIMYCLVAGFVRPAENQLPTYNRRPGLTTALRQQPACNEQRRLDHGRI
jgi:hypothetical protein